MSDNPDEVSHVTKQDGVPLPPRPTHIHPLNLRRWKDDRDDRRSGGGRSHRRTEAASFLSRRDAIGREGGDLGGGLTPST